MSRTDPMNHIRLTNDGPPKFTEPPPRPTDGNLTRHAWDELNREDTVHRSEPAVAS